MWLSHLLNMACDALVVHEPLPAETIDHRRALEEPHSPAVEAHAGFRIRDMVRRLEHSGKARYGEVCPPLRRHVQHLRRLCPEIQCFHLIRDGRAVVMSMMNRATLTEHDKVYCGFYPSEDLVSRTRWRSMDRFARICWLWAQENAFLREHCSRTVRFEDITRSFALFREQLLLPLDIEITESLWASSVAKRMNETLSPRLTADSWSSRQEQHFDEICGAEMRNAGYIE